MFNSTSKIMPYTMPGSSVQGVILPHSDKVLYSSDINRKIEKAQSHIEHLTESLSYRKTHGGSAFRARNISINDQISSASERLELLQLAKTILTTQSDLTWRLNGYSRPFNRSVHETLGFSLPRAEYSSEQPSSTVSFAGKMRTVTVLRSTYLSKN